MKPGGSGISRDEGEVELSVNPTAHRRPEPITAFPLSMIEFDKVENLRTQSQFDKVSSF